MTLGVSGAGNKDQTLTIPTSSYATGYFTLQYDYQETAPISLGATSTQIRDALAALQLLDTHQTGVWNLDVDPVDLSDPSKAVYKIHFHTTDIGPAVALVARLVPIMVDTAGGADNLRVQATYEQLFYSGGAGQDNVMLSANALTDQPLSASEVVAQISVNATDLHHQKLTMANVTGGHFALQLGTHKTSALGWDVSPEFVAAAMLTLLHNEGSPSATAADVSVHRDGTGYDIDFANTLTVGALSALASGVDAGKPYRLLSNGLAAVVTVDGGDDSDQYTVNLIGGDTSSLINVYDSGDITSGTDTLTINGTSHPDYFLLRAATALSGLAFIALVNAADPHNVGRCGSGRARELQHEPREHHAQHAHEHRHGGCDQRRHPGRPGLRRRHARDHHDQRRRQRRPLPDRPALQVASHPAPRRDRARGRLRHDRDDAAAGCSNGVTNPLTINGGKGNDNFIVFHNLAALDLNGDDGDDTFIVQAFALAGSQDDFRALTDLSGGAGADLIQYAVNAPVNIDGGDGFDTIIVIGTEFGDDFVVTKDGVFGAGLNINFVEHRVARGRRRRGRRPLLRPQHRHQLQDDDHRRPRQRPDQRPGPDAGATA